MNGSYEIESFKNAVDHMSSEQLLSGMRFIRALLNSYGEYNNACGWCIDELTEMEDCIQDEILVRFAGLVDGYSLKEIERKSA